MQNSRPITLCEKDLAKLNAQPIVKGVTIGLRLTELCEECRKANGLEDSEDQTCKQ